MSSFTFGIVTVSDSCSEQTKVDESGPKIQQLLKQFFSVNDPKLMTVPDDQAVIEKILRFFCDDLKLNCVMTTGGTGFAPRDVTPEATLNVIQKECPFLANEMYNEGRKKTPFAALSRAVCGIRGSTLIINFPGSKKAVVECFEAIQNILPHAIQLIIDKKIETNAMHVQMQTEALDQSSSEMDFDSSSVISSTSGVSSLFRRIDNINEKRTQIEESIKDKRKSLDSSVNSEIFSTPIKQEKKEIDAQMDEFLKSSARGMVEIKLDDEILSTSSSSSSAFKSHESSPAPKSVVSPPRHQPHVCPHKTANLDDKDDRNSPYPMIEVEEAIRMIFERINSLSEVEEMKSPMNLPPFRASIKDGYAVKSSSKNKMRKVIGNISAGDRITQTDFNANDCYKINTGAPVPTHADAILQVEDTKLIKSMHDGTEDEIEVLKFPNKNLDIREIGCDLMEGETLFRTEGLMDVAKHSILASVGIMQKQRMPKIAIISTGDELVNPDVGELREGQIYDSNSTMLKLLVQKHGFDVNFMAIAKDDHQSLKGAVEGAMKTSDVIISSGGVSMGDKDFVKPLMKELGFEILFGRVNMKPGKPMTFATNGKTSYFALPGNPVSAFVTFHLFVLPSLRYMCGCRKAQCFLPEIYVILQIDKYTLDPRPEYARARVTQNKENGIFYAHMPQNQMSSRLASLIDAKVLLHLPGSTKARPTLNKGFKLKATILDTHFISDYQN